MKLAGADPSAPHHRCDGGVAVEERLHDRLRHAFEEGLDLRKPEVGGVAVQVGDVLVDHRVGFQITDGVDDLGSG